MIKIAIAESSQNQRESLKKMLIEFGRENSAELEIHEYETGIELIDNLWNGFGIILLDHDMCGREGMETARAIRRRDKKLILIFVSSQDDLWEDGFEVEAFSYLIRPVTAAKFKSVLAKAFKKLSEDSKSVLIITEAGMLVLDLNEIICFKEHDDRYTEIFHRRSGSIYVDRIKITISDIEKQIYPHGFIRPHGSCLVNPLHIKRVFGKNHCKYIETSTGEEILISRHFPDQLHLICEH